MSISQKQDRGAPLADFVSGIDRFNASQANAPLLDAVRRYNHQVIDDLDRIRPLRGVRLLDVGASPHGYALERALARGVHRYVGIGLDIHEPRRVAGAAASGELLAGNAEALEFPDRSFDTIVTVSTFEHIADLPRALSELHRVLVPGGNALATFEPLWTCSYGHHLHHFGAISSLIPDWAHLIWSEARMREHLEGKWPADAPIGLEDALRWIYHGRDINRIGIVEMRRIMGTARLDLEWLVPIPDVARDAGQLGQAARATGLLEADLMTRGFTAHFVRR